MLIAKQALHPSLSVHIEDVHEEIAPSNEPSLRWVSMLRNMPSQWPIDSMLYDFRIHVLQAELAQDARLAPNLLGPARHDILAQPEEWPRP